MEQKNIIKIKDYNKNKINLNIDGVILDTNVLIDLYYPGNKNNRSKITLENLSNIHEDLRQKNLKFYIILPIISEFYNFAIKVAHKNYCENNKFKINLKKYRNTMDFKEELKSILLILDGILSDFKYVNHDFEFINDTFTQKLLENLDFTDLMLRKFCVEKNILLITLDKDFKKVYSNEYNLIVE